MNSNNNNTRDTYKECSSRDCHNIGINRLRIVFLHKCGWFCDTCKGTMLNDELVEEVIDYSE